jgi:adenylate cyclase
MAEQVARKLLQADIHDPGRRTATISTWLTKHGGIRVDPQTLMLELCERLIAAGVPLSGASYGAPTLHPQVWGSQFIWRRDGGGVSEVRHRHHAARSSTYRDSPVRVLHQGAAAVRRRLDIPAPQLDFPILRELADEGATDYVAMPLHFSSGKMGYISWVSDRLGGFNTSDLALLYDLLPLIALRVELEASYQVSKSLMETYLGRDAARRVLTGQIKRGRGKRIRAAIFLSDLRDFTAMSDRLPANEVIVLLNDYFDIMATQVQEHGGEVLKFIGDAVMAIFPLREHPDAGERALAAADEALAKIAKANAERTSPDEPKLAISLALHQGEVNYGNVGIAGRLDFTVTGPAVNEVARLEGLSKTLDQPVVTSAAYATLYSERLTCVGRQKLRGVSA